MPPENITQNMETVEVKLVPLQPDDREQFILDNQWAFKYGAQQEFGIGKGTKKLS